MDPQERTEQIGHQEIREGMSDQIPRDQVLVVVKSDNLSGWREQGREIENCHFARLMKLEYFNLYTFST